MNSAWSETTKSSSSSPLSRDSSPNDVYRPPVTLEVARRLLASGAITGTQTQTALFLHVTRPMPFLRALLECGVDPDTIDSELRRGDLPRLRNVIPAYELVQRLPSGMCGQLLAVPVRLDPITFTVDVAVADPFDAHILQEFSFHLASPVRLVQAGIVALETALAHVEQEERRTPHRARATRSFTPAFGTATPRFPLPVIKTNSELPIPLVRRSKPPPPREEDDTGRTTRDAIVLDPGSLPAARPSLADMSPNGGSIQPESLEIIIPKDAAVPDFDASDTSPFLNQAALGFESALDNLARASCRDEVVLAALGGMATVSQRVGVFAVRRDAFTGWACTRSFASEAEFKSLRVDRRANTVFAHAAAKGWYFGPVPATEGHEQLVALLPDPSEVAIVAVRLQGRPAMLILATQLIDSMIATRIAERLANASAKALLRVLRTEKRQDR